MAKRKGISISLAAKCQLLFGLAVLVIIAGALAVPWQRMEQLATQPNKKAARFAADLVFRALHAQTTARTGGGGGGEGESPGSKKIPWNDVGLTETHFPQPRVLGVSSPTGGYIPAAATMPSSAPAPVWVDPKTGRPPVLPAPADAAEEPLAKSALRLFRDRPSETEFGEMGTFRDKRGEAVRIYRYAAAVRLDASCLRCHENYANWVPGLTANDASPATGAAGPGGGGADSPAAAMPVAAVVRVDVPYQTDENQLLLNRIVIVVAGMLGGALAIVVFYLITSRLILQPVRVLKNTAEKVAKGDLNIRSAISTGDEFQHLSETFNTMLATLKASQDQLEATNRSLDTRVGELAQSNVDLFEANRLKSEFLTNVTHELRTPLNAIIGFADLLADTAKDPKQQRYSENIRTSAKQLLDLINDLLDLAKIEAGKLVLREEKVSVGDVCEAMANFMRPLAQKKNIALELSVDPEMPLITTDPGRFQQILYNFLSNAIKFTPPDGRVAIVARGETEGMAGGAARAALAPATDGEGGTAVAAPAAEAPAVPKKIRISIIDTGPGISPEDQQVIFEKFRQLDGSVTRQHSGSGLGLTIARELANMLGGRIELVSAVGKGATFSLVMPIESPHRTVDMHAAMENG
jgi:signal transduction histidine kinase